MGKKSKKKQLTDKQLLMRSCAIITEIYQVVGDAMFHLDDKKALKKKKENLRVGKRLLAAADLLSNELFHWNSRLNTHKDVKAFEKELDYVSEKLKDD